MSVSAVDCVKDQASGSAVNRVSCILYDVPAPPAPLSFLKVSLRPLAEACFPSVLCGSLEAVDQEFTRFCFYSLNNCQFIVVGLITAQNVLGTVFLGIF